MANPDVSLLASSFVEFGGTIFGKHVLGWNIRSQGVQVRTNVKAPQTLTKLSAVGNPVPYASADNTAGNGTKFTDRILTVHNSKWDYDYDPEQFRNTYLAKADGVPFAQASADQLAKEYLASIVSNVLYLGNYNAAGTTAATIATGWGTLLAAEITAANITPVATGAITISNAVASFEAMVTAAPLWLREQGGIIYCSYGSFDLYRKNYRATYGFTFDANTAGDYKMDNVNFIIRPVAWMGTSGRLILTVDQNLVFGTDIEGIQVAASMRRNIIECRPMMAVGCQFQDLDALLVNDQA